MIAEKKYEITIEVENPINFCIGKHDHIMVELNRLYVSKCLDGAYILNIKKILDTSKCKIVDISSNGRIDVMFIAYVSYVKPWDIIIGTTVIINDNLIISRSVTYNKEIIVTIKPSNIVNNNLIEIGNMLPIRVIKPSHKPTTNNLYIAAVLLTCDVNAPVYKVEGKIILNDVLSYIIKNIKEEIEKREKLMLENKKNIKFFENLLFSYQNFTHDGENLEIDNNLNYYNFGLNKGFNILNLKSGEIISGYWTRDLSLCRSSPLMTKIEDTTDYIKTTPMQMVLDYGNQIYHFLVAIRQMVELYDDDMILSHENIWDMMRSKQKPN